MVGRAYLRSSRLNDTTIEMVVTGHPTADDLISFMNSTFPNTPFRDVLWDLTQASLAMLDISEFQTIEDVASQYSAARGPDLKTAILLSSATDLLLVRAYTAMTLDLRPSAIRASTNRQELLDWLAA
ncbi:hypothetical protein [Thalassobaculum sp.]|uniref:hypothetical protein n=1 Tax=Thalassobaculum sp. TaxID=2022740 RepID=UPI003B5A92EB